MGMVPPLRAVIVGWLPIPFIDREQPLAPDIVRRDRIEPVPFAKSLTSNWITQRPDSGATTSRKVCLETFRFTPQKFRLFLSVHTYLEEARSRHAATTYHAKAGNLPTYHQQSI